VVGIVAETGSDVAGWQPGDRVALGWFGGSCGHCTACRSGDVVHCPERQVPGVSYPGGWSTTVPAPAAALARIPDDLALADAAPFGSAGVTTYNAVRRAPGPAGGRIAVVGVGGLGHLAIRFAAAMGHETVAIGRGPAKSDDARALGAHHYIDSTRQDPGTALRELGGAHLILSTASSSTVLPGLVEGLCPHGILMVVGFDGSPFPVDLGRLVPHARSVTGHLTGSPVDTEHAMQFAMANDIRPWIETIPLNDVAEALRTQQDGRALPHGSDHRQHDGDRRCLTSVNRVPHRGRAGPAPW
jgi:alcohol dehydrogenase